MTSPVVRSSVIIFLSTSPGRVHAHRSPRTSYSRTHTARDLPHPQQSAPAPSRRFCLPSLVRVGLCTASPEPLTSPTHLDEHRRSIPFASLYKKLFGPLNCTRRIGRAENCHAVQDPPGAPLDYVAHEAVVLPTSPRNEHLHLGGNPLTFPCTEYLVHSSSRIYNSGSVLRLTQPNHGSISANWFSGMTILTTTELASKLQLFRGSRDMRFIKARSSGTCRTERGF